MLKSLSDFTSRELCRDLLSSSLIERLFVVGGGGDEDDAMIGGESIGDEGDGVDLVDVISFGIGGVLGASVE
ncbi:hypothetical protein BLOT_014156 [Blomia tropicalis]|nr:hypothetical protein BLOT_014156 [Blomia tropicalis]